MDKTFGIIGAGHIGTAVAKHFVEAGYQVILANQSGPEKLKNFIQEMGPLVKAGTIKEAAQMDIVVIAIPWTQLDDVLGSLPNWNGRIVIDATNPFISFDPIKVADLGGKTSSEVVADKLPGARVVKAFNTVYAEVLALNPREANGNRVIFMSGNDKLAKKECAEAITKAGFAVIDLGDLVTGGRMQQFNGPLASTNLIRLSNDEAGK